MAAAAGRLGARDRRAIAVDLPGFGHGARLAPGPMLPQLDAFAAALVEQWAGRGEDVVVAGNSLGGVRRAARWPSGDDLPLAGVVPVAPAGWTCRAGSTSSSATRSCARCSRCRMPIARAVCARRSARSTASSRSRARGAAEARGRRRVRRHHASRDARRRACSTSGRRLLPELPTAPFRLRRDRAARCCSSGARATAWSRTAARSVVLDALPGTRVELLEGCGHCPQLEATERLLELLLAVPRPRR